MTLPAALCHVVPQVYRNGLLGRESPPLRDFGRGHNRNFIRPGEQPLMDLIQMSSEGGPQLRVRREARARRVRRGSAVPALRKRYRGRLSDPLVGERGGDPRGRALETTPVHLEIGRASCRESVDIGGRRSIKKKNETTRTEPY